MTDKHKIMILATATVLLVLDRLAAVSLLRTADKKLVTAEKERDLWKDRAESQRLTTELLTIDNRALRARGLR